LKGQDPRAASLEALNRRSPIADNPDVMDNAAQLLGFPRNLAGQPVWSLAVPSSRIGGSTVLSAANVHVIARSGIRIIWQQARMVLRYVEHDRPCLEQAEVAFFVGRNLPERMKRQMCGLLHRHERNKTNLVGLTHFF
jgi:hypothetical protein